MRRDDERMIEMLERDSKETRKTRSTRAESREFPAERPRKFAGLAAPWVPVNARPVVIAVTKLFA